MSKILIVAEHLNGKLNSATARCVTCATRVTRDRRSAFPEECSIGFYKVAVRRDAINLYASSDSTGSPASIQSNFPAT